MLKFIKKQMNKDGFTLVELIIVIAVMAILAAIVVPKMAGITESFKIKADERVGDSIAREIEAKILTGITLGNSSGLASLELSDSSVAKPKQKGAGLDFYYIYTVAVDAVAAGPGGVPAAVAAVPGKVEVFVSTAVNGTKTSVVTRDNVSKIE